MSSVIRSPAVRETRVIPTRSNPSSGPRPDTEAAVPVDSKDSESADAEPRAPIPTVEMVAESQEAEERISPALVAQLQAELAATKTQLEQLLAKIDEVRIRANEEGRAAGYQAGLEEARKESGDMLRALRKLLVALPEQWKMLVGKEEDTLIEIVYAATAKILGEAFATREGAVAAIRQAIMQVTQRDRLIVRVAVDQYALLDEHRDVLLEGIADTLPELRPDDRVQLGCCILETSGGTLDARLEVQLQSLRDLLLNVRHGRSEGYGEDRP